MLDDSRDRERDDLRVSRIRLETRCNCIILKCTVPSILTSVRLDNCVTMFSRLHILGLDASCFWIES